MRGKRSWLRGSTLAEMLIMMIVAGIVLLGTMEGLMLFNRLLRARSEALLARQRMTDGYFRMESLAAKADSIRLEDGELELFYETETASVQIGDSALICRMGALCDTLLRPVERLDAVHGGDGADTIRVGMRLPAGRITLRFCRRPSPDGLYRTQIEKIEQGHGYEE